MASRASRTITDRNDLEEAPLVAYGAFGAVRGEVGSVEVVSRVWNEHLAPVVSGTADQSVTSPRVGMKQFEGQVAYKPSRAKRPATTGSFVCIWNVLGDRCLVWGRERNVTSSLKDPIGTNLREVTLRFI